MSRRNDPGRQAREALERALLGADMSAERLVEAVPLILAEAERRQRRRERTEVASVARTWLPRLALAAAGLAAAAWLWPADPASSEVDEGAVLDAWIVTGNTESAVADPVMDALVRREDRP